MNRKCLDDNPKIVKRLYDWDGRQVEISLCQSHQQDPDFFHFVSETKIFDHKKSIQKFVNLTESKIKSNNETLIEIKRECKN